MVMQRMSNQKACFLSNSTDSPPKPSDLQKILERVSIFSANISIYPELVTRAYPLAAMESCFALLRTQSLDCKQSFPQKSINDIVVQQVSLMSCCFDVQTLILDSPLEYCRDLVSSSSSENSIL